MYRTLHILVVDDHAFQRRSITSMVTQLAPYDIRQACDGDEAIGLIAEKAPDIVICDLAMPNIDGLELLRHLSDLGFTGSIILSSASDASLMRAASNLVNIYGLHLLGVMPKPSSRQQLKHFFTAHQQRIEQFSKPTKVDLKLTKQMLSAALNDQQFIVHFQPQVAFDTGQCIGFEALCRWQHPELGLLTAYHFIDKIIAEGLMPLLTLSIIEQCVAAIKEFDTVFSHTKMSINLTPLCLSHQLLESIFANSELMNYASQKRISFEVTEQTELLKESRSLELLSRLRLNGFNLSVDDFGTGYSSLLQLSLYPFNEIKLDQSFVQYADTDSQSAAIVEMSIQLAKKLDMKVVVEGVENYSQWQCMKALGADLCQGYFSAKPMPKEQLSQWYTQWIGEYQTFMKADLDESRGHTD